MNIGQETTTSASPYTLTPEVREPFPWAAAIVVWTWFIALGFILGVVVSLLA